MSDNNEDVKFKGFVRVNVVNSDGEIVGDSGFVTNAIQALGFTDMIANSAIGGTTKDAQYLAIGSINNAAAINSTNLSSNFNFVGTTDAIITGAALNRSTVATANGIVARFTGEFVGTDYMANGNQVTIDAISGLNGTNLSTILFGTNFTQSTWSNDQSVKVTYDLKWTQ
jgi:hypothetical protein